MNQNRVTLGIPFSNALLFGRRWLKPLCRAVASAQTIGSSGGAPISSALISGPHWEKGVFGGDLKYYCAKVRIQNLGITGTADIKFSALISEGPRGISVNGSREWGEPRCSTPYRSFDELEAFNQQT